MLHGRFKNSTIKIDGPRFSEHFFRFWISPVHDGKTDVRLGTAGTYVPMRSGVV